MYRVWFKSVQVPTTRYDLRISRTLISRFSLVCPIDYSSSAICVHATRREKNCTFWRWIERANSSRSNHASKMSPFDFVSWREDRLTRPLWFDYGVENRERLRDKNVDDGVYWQRDVG